MKNKIRKLMAIVLAAVSIFSVAAPAAGMGGVFHFAVSAANGEEYTSGYYTYIVENGAATITKVDEIKTSYVIIPAALDGYPVEKIAPYAFGICETLEQVMITKSLKEADHAFSNTASITDVIFGDGVTEIPAGIFDGVSTLKSLQIPNSVKKVNQYAFNGCDALTDVDYSGFENEWDDIVIEKGNNRLLNANINCEGMSSYLEYEIIDGEAVITNCDKIAKGSIRIPESIEKCPVTKIGEGAFSDSSIYEIVIPDSVKIIGEGAFSGCEALKRVKMSANIEEIGDFAFEDCNITSMELPKTLKSIGLLAFSGQDDTVIDYKSLAKYMIDKGELDFSDEELEMMKLLGGEEYVFEYAGLAIEAFFSLFGASSKKIAELESEEIPVKQFVSHQPLNITIDKANPYYCVDSQGIIYDKNKTKVIEAVTPKKEYVIPDSVTTIDDFAFYAGDYASEDSIILEKITLPDGLKKIGDYAFAYCINLKEITIPDGVTEIGEAAFGACNSLKEVTIPASVNKIGEAAFGACNSLKEVIIPASVDKIGEGAFEECENLEKVTIKDGVTVIGEDAFGNCVSLKEITIPESVTTIGEEAFYNCDNLTIKCYADSAAQKYAEENGINYIVIAKPKASKVDIQDSLVIYYKDSAKIKATIIADEGAKYEIKYESSNPKVATVDKNGNITTTGKGNTTITCKVTDNAGNIVKDTCNVTVKFQWWQWLIWILLFGFLWY